MRELRKLSVEKHLQKHQEMYFGSKGANPQAIASAIAQGALVLGASRILIEEKNGWWYVCANLDWFEVPTVPEVRPDTVYGSVWGFPQAGHEWHRSEVMARVFSEATFTIKGKTVTRVCGELPPDPEILAQVGFLGDWERIVAFKFMPLPFEPLLPTNPGLNRDSHA